MRKIKIKLIGGGKLPEFKTSGSVCADCYARLGKSTCIIEPNNRALIPLGFALGLPKGYEAVVRPRSGYTKNGVDNGIGTIDFDYTGEVMACVINNTKEDLRIENGDRICQLAIRKAPKVKFVITEELKKTERGSNGFGSTGKK